MLKPLADIYFEDEPKEQVRAARLPIQVRASDLLTPADARQTWATVVAEDTFAGWSVFMATEEGLELGFWEELCERLTQPLPSKAPVEPLPAPTWASGCVSKRFEDPVFLELVRRFGVNAPPHEIDTDEIEDEGLLELLDVLEPTSPSVASGAAYILQHRTIQRAGERPDKIPWPTYAGEEQVRVFACQCHQALGPLSLGWMWNTEYAQRVASYWARWSDTVGFRPVLVGRSTLDAYVAKPPTELTQLRELVEDQLTFCPDLGQGDHPVVGATLNALGHRWSFWWD